MGSGLAHLDPKPCKNLYIEIVRSHWYDAPKEHLMGDEPPKDLATRAFQKRVLDEFAAVRREQAAFSHELRGELSLLRVEETAMRQDITEIRAQQAAMTQSLASLDERLTSLEQRVDARLQETRPIWEAVQEQVQRLLEKFDVVLHDLYDVRGELKIHGRRIGELERRVLP
jgi:chromosome segregation ATPase